MEAATTERPSSSRSRRACPSPTVTTGRKSAHLVDPAVAGQKRTGRTDPYHPYAFLLQACDVSEAAALVTNSEAAWGLHSLIKLARDRSEKAVEQPNEIEVFEEASKEIAGAIGVLNAINDDAMDCGLLFAAETLLQLAKRAIDDRASEMAR